MQKKYGNYEAKYTGFGLTIKMRAVAVLSLCAQSAEVLKKLAASASAQ